MPIVKVSATKPNGIILKQFIVDCPIGLEPETYGIKKIEWVNARRVIEGNNPLYPAGCELTAEPVFCSEDYCEL